MGLSCEVIETMNLSKCLVKEIINRKVYLPILVTFYIPGKYQKIRSFLMFLGGYREISDMKWIKLAH